MLKGTGGKTAGTPEVRQCGAPSVWGARRTWDLRGYLLPAITTTAWTGVPTLLASSFSRAAAGT
jgi:hypothetical protein